MNTLLWVVQIVLAAAFLGAGAMKLAQSRNRLRAMMAWVEDRTDAQLKTIASLEVLGAAGMVLPGVLHWAPVLTPLAALGLGLTMVGALILHARRGEGGQTALPIALLVLAAFVAWGRFGPHPLA